MGLKNKTISGLKWSFIDNLSNQVIHFVVGIILARLLSPSEFGVIGIITVFTSMAQLIVDSGFSRALIRKRECTEEDWNTMLFANLFFGFAMCGLLVLLAPSVERYYGVPDVAKLLRVMSLVLIINGFGLVEQTQLIRNVDFKSITQISLVSGVLSGIVGIVMALYGYSYWSLLWKAIVQNLVRVILLYIKSKWRPKPIFSISAFKEMFAFGSRMLISQFISKAYSNLYYFLIGKYFSVTQLGLYTRAEQFKNLPTDGMMVTIQRVTFPILAQLEDKPSQQLEAYRKLMRVALYVIITIIVGIIFSSREIIAIVLGDKWLETIPYLQILSLSAITLPLRHINMNIVMAKNRPDLYLKIQITTNLMFIPFVYFGVRAGIYPLLFVVVLISVIEYIVISIATSQTTNYPLKLQIMDAAPILAYASGLSIMQYIVHNIGVGNIHISLLLKIFTLVASTVLIGRIFKMNEYLEVISIIKSQLRLLYVK